MMKSRAEVSIKTEAVINCLAQAFQGEPTFSYILPDSIERARRLPEAFKIFVKEDARKGHIFATPECEAVTLWRPPGTVHDNLWDSLRLALPYVRALGGGVWRGSKVADLIAQNMPKEPFWYLHFAGCAPKHQGKGMGGTAIRMGLEAVDAECAHAYLETADASNVHLYRNFGFEVVRNWKVRGGPEFWGMIRPPQ